MTLRTCPDCGHIFNAKRHCAKCFPDPQKAEYKRLREQGLKRCAKCKELLALSEFDKRPERNGNERSLCKICNLDRHNVWRKENPDKVHKQYERRPPRDPDFMLVVRIRHRARARGLSDIFTVADWQRAKTYWLGCCAYCGNQQGLFHNTLISAEHFIPLSSPDCPGTIPDNILPVCLSCNASRKKQDVLKWLSTKQSSIQAAKILDKISVYFAWLKTV